MKKPVKRWKDKRVLLNISNKRWRHRLKSKRANKARHSHAMTNNTSQQSAVIGHSRYKITLTAPQNFSFISNTQESVRFIDRLNSCLEKRISVYVDLKQVTTLTYDAILALLSIMFQIKRRGIAFNGNFPRDAVCSKLLRNSGFLDNLYNDKVRFPFDLTQKHLIRKFGNEALPEEASRIVDNSHLNIWKTSGRCPGVYRIILELMQNTHAHANLSQPGGVNWWFGVNYDELRNVECFSFIDYGVGVFTSLENKTSESKFYKALEKMKTVLGLSNNADALRHIMNGDLHRTSTGKSYRGKGLPGIRDALMRDQISKLVVVTNNVVAEVGANRYDLLPNSFRGTFIYWELSNQCKYHYADNNS